MRIEVHVRPRAGRRSVEMEPDGRCVVRVTEPAEDGRANDALIASLAEHFGVPKRAVTIVRGHTSRSKLVEIATEQKRR